MKISSFQLPLFEALAPVAQSTREAIRAVVNATAQAFRDVRAERPTPQAKRRKQVAPRRDASATYEVMVRAMLAQYSVHVRKWRTSMSGVAYVLSYRDGTTKRMLESPRPRSPLSAAIFLHEIGHHAIGIGVYKPRCLEEYHAWMYSLAQMRVWNIECTPKVQRRVRRSLQYAVGKARRRGIKNLPAELLAFEHCDVNAPLEVGVSELARA